jgi:hypothetical protein
MEGMTPLHVYLLTLCSGIGSRTSILLVYTASQKCFVDTYSMRQDNVWANYKFVAI